MNAGVKNYSHFYSNMVNQNRGKPSSIENFISHPDEKGLGGYKFFEKYEGNKKYQID